MGQSKRRGTFEERTAQAIAAAADRARERVSTYSKERRAELEQSARSSIKPVTLSRRKLTPMMAAMMVGALHVPPK